MHTCSRDDCPPANVNGPTTKCAKCKKVCYLKCFGIEKCATFDDVDVIKYVLPNGAAIHTFLPYSSFVCCVNNVSTTELKKMLVMPKAPRGTSQSRQQKTKEQDTMMSDLASMKKTIENIHAIAAENNTNIKALQHKSNEIQVVPNTQTNALTPSFARLLNGQLSASASPKRRRVGDDLSQQKKVIANLPRPVYGTRDIAIGPVPETFDAAISKPKQNSHPKFNKAIWVGGLHTSVTVEMMNDFMLTKTDIKDQNHFRCQRLVGKNVNINDLSVISYKICVNDEHLQHLLNPDIWPPHVKIREFIEKPPVKLGEHLDAAFGSLNSPTKQRKTDEKNEHISAMETNA